MASPVSEEMIEIVAGDALDAMARREIIALCEAAFAEDFGQLFVLLPGSRHVLLRDGGLLVGHACWVTRWLQPAGSPPLRTAYVEAVVTLPARQGQGWGKAAMERVVAETVRFDLRALSAAVPAFYARLGWQAWRGPTAIRRGDTPEPTPDEEIMILPTLRTPPLDLDAPISAEWREGEFW